MRAAARSTRNWPSGAAKSRIFTKLGQSPGPVTIRVKHEVSRSARLGMAPRFECRSITEGVLRLTADALVKDVGEQLLTRAFR